MSTKLRKPISPALVLIDNVVFTQADKKECARSSFLLTNQRRINIIKKYLERWLSWSKAHDWKSCVGLNSPRVRIPLSPPDCDKSELTLIPIGDGFGFVFL